MLSRLAPLLRHPATLCSLSFLCCFVLALLLNLPLTPLSNQLIQLARQHQLQLQLQPPELLFPPGLGVERLEIGTEQLSRPLLLTELALYPLWSTLVGDNPGVRFRAQTLQGKVDGVAFRNGRVDAQLAGLQFNEALGPQLPLTISGRLDNGSLIGVLPVQKGNDSRLQLAFNALELAGLQKFGASDDLLPLGQLHCQIDISGETLTLNRLDLSGTALTLSGRGTVRLGATPARSSLNLELELTPQSALDPMLRGMLELLQKPQPDGSYLLRLSGTLAKPLLK